MRAPVLLAVALCAWSCSVFARTIVQFRTPLGNMEVELFTGEKPVTCSNFLRLLDAGAYQNGFMHRVVPGFVAQGGGFRVADPLSTNLFTSPIAVPNFGPITNEYNVGPQFSNLFGTIAMAKTTNSPDTATSQWFFNLADNATNPPAFLDTQNGGFTVFGRVVRGTNVLNILNSFAYSNGLVNLVSFYGASPSTLPFTTLPVGYLGWAAPRNVDLLYVGISASRLTASNLTDGTTRLSWRSAADMTNIVEWSGSVTSATWTVLHVTNGTGNTLSILDTNTPTAARVYRIRFEP